MSISFKNHERVDCCLAQTCWVLRQSRIHLHVSMEGHAAGPDYAGPHYAGAAWPQVHRAIGDGFSHSGAQDFSMKPILHAHHAWKEAFAEGGRSLATPILVGAAAVFKDGFPLFERLQSVSN